MNLNHIDISLLQEAELEEFKQSTYAVEKGLFVAVDAEDIDLLILPAHTVLEIGKSTDKYGDMNLHVRYLAGGKEFLTHISGSYAFIHK